MIHKKVKCCNLLQTNLLFFSIQTTCSSASDSSLLLSRFFDFDFFFLSFTTHNIRCCHRGKAAARVRPDRLKNARVTQTDCDVIVNLPVGCCHSHTSTGTIWYDSSTRKLVKNMAEMTKALQ